jgi:anthranilate/para-aminobenzoate synthase component I
VPSAAGLYFGCDAGIAGLHPREATLIDAPALAIHIHTDGAELQPRSALGQALCAHAALASCLALAGRGPGRSAMGVLRAFLAACGNAPEALLLGALRFEAHRLARPEPGAGEAPLGVFYFATRYWHRDAHGAWQHVALHIGGVPDLVDDAPQASQAAAAAPASAPLPAHPPRDDFAPGAYAAVVARAVELLRSEPLVSLTLSQSFRRRVQVAPGAAFARLRAVNPAPVSFFLRTPDGEALFGASPDLQLVVRGRDVAALPVCGTVARQPDAVGEAASLHALINEEVDAASLAVCSEALGNDLAPLCEPGSLRLTARRQPMALATVVHTVDRLQGTLRAGVDAWDAVLATAAPVMLTGTPRQHALAAIARLEAGPRGWYGGMVVQVAADGGALVGTLLRAASLHDGIAEVRTGGDLMADSDPPREEHESRLKAISLWRALGLSDDAAAPAAPAQLATLAMPQAVALHDGADPWAQTAAAALQGPRAATRRTGGRACAHRARWRHSSAGQPGGAGRGRARRRGAARAGPAWLRGRALRAGPWPHAARAARAGRALERGALSRSALRDPSARCSAPRAARLAGVGPGRGRCAPGAGTPGHAPRLPAVSPRGPAGRCSRACRLAPDHRLGRMPIMRPMEDTAHA